jgi:PPOX class probable F420-dependent enzyme
MGGILAPANFLFVEIPSSAVRRLLDGAPVGRLAMLADDGAPTAVPIVYVLIGDELWSPIDGKPKRGRPLARVRNVQRDPRVSVLVDAYTDDWRQLWWIRIAGRARVESAEGAEPVLAALRRKYPQYATTPLLDPSARLLAIRIARLATWCASATAWSDA